MITNFPTKGDDKKVSLSNSQYNLFDLDFAERIKTMYPKIWELGGNIRGNTAYMLGYRNRTKGDLTPDVEAWIKEREAWSARHFENFRIAGVIALIKWHTVGSRGESFMKNLVNEEIAKRYKIEKSSNPFGFIDFLEK